MAKKKPDKPPLLPKHLLILQPRVPGRPAHWVKTDSRMAMRLLRLKDEILRDPFAETGKPSPQKAPSPNVWSRRLGEVDDWCIASEMTR